MKKGKKSGYFKKHKGLRTVLVGCLLTVMVCQTISSAPVVREEPLIHPRGCGARLSQDSHRLSKKQMYRDFDAFWKDIRENYPYMELVEKKQKGRPIKQWEAECRKKIKGLHSDEEFYHLIQLCVEPFHSYGHLQVIDQVAYKSYLDIYTAYQSYPHCRYLSQILNNRASRCFYGALRTNDSHTITPGRFAGNIRDWLPQMEVIEQGKTVMLKLPGFETERMKGEEAILKDFFQRYQDYQYCILDIRGNGGGNTDYWRDFIVKPNLQKDTLSWHCQVFKGKRAFSYLSQEWRIGRTIQLPLSKMPNFNRRQIWTLPYGVVNQSYDSKAEHPVFHGKFYLLTDENVYSAAEAFAAYCKQTGFATLVGRPTGGDGLGADPLIGILPESGIAYRFSASMGLNPDGSINEELGTIPDVVIGKNQDALDACISLIQR